MTITKEDWKEGLIFFAGFIGVVLLFGKIVDSQRDTDQDWEAYCKQKQQPQK